jgi:hypothetical protein
MGEYVVTVTYLGFKERASHVKASMVRAQMYAPVFSVDEHVVLNQLKAN